MSPHSFAPAAFPRYASTSLLLGVLIGTTLPAQTPADSSRPAAWHLRVSAGPDVRNASTSGLGTLGLEWERDARLAVRLNSEYYSRLQNNPNFTADLCTSICTSRVRTGFMGVSADGRFNLLTGKVRPYIVSGLGFYRAISVKHSNLRCETDYTCVITPGELSDLRRSTFGLGMHAGLGLSMQWRGTQIFTESRYQTVMDASTRGAFAMPVTFGIRF